MRTESYSRYLSRMQALLGIDSMLASEEVQFLDYFQANIRYAWENFEWPELCTEEGRPVTDDNTIDLDDGVETAIGEVLAVWDRDPDLPCGACEVGYTLGPFGVKVGPGSFDSVWVRYRYRIPDYRGDDYSGATHYVAGDQTYYPTTGRFYVALQSAFAQAPTNDSYWEEIEIPYCLFEFVVRASYSDALLAEGMDAKATAERAKADMWLLQEIEKVSRQQRQHHRHNVVRTHGSTQSRR